MNSLVSYLISECATTATAAPSIRLCCSPHLPFTISVGGGRGGGRGERGGGIPPRSCMSISYRQCSGSLQFHAARFVYVPAKAATSLVIVTSSNVKRSSLFKRRTDGRTDARCRFHLQPLLNISPPTPPFAGTRQTKTHKRHCSRCQQSTQVRSQKKKTLFQTTILN